MSARSAVLIALLFAAAWFGTLGVRPLYKSDESRYAEIPREMVASGDWLTPRLNGFKYFEKPPLQYWTTAAFFSVAGEKDWAARLWTALTGFMGVLLAFFTARKLWGQSAGILAAAILAGCPLYAILSQVNTLDMGLAFFLSAAMFAFVLGHVMLFWAACALAVLSKGLVGIVLPLGTIGLYILLTRNWRLIREMRPVTGPLLFLAIAAPWFVAVSLANPEFAHFFFIQEHFQRFTTKMHGRYQPAWYFLPILAFGIAPWLLALFLSVKSTLRGNAAQRLLALWIVVVFAFFSVSSSKLPSYILPMFPPLAVLLAGTFGQAQPRRLLLVQALLTAAGAIAVAALLPRAAADYAAYVPWLIGALGCAALGALAAAFLHGKTVHSVLALAIGTFAGTQVALAGHRVLADSYSVAGLVTKAPIPAGATIYAYDTYDHTIPWYTRRTVTMALYTDELEKAIAWEPHKFIRGEHEFASRWNAERAAYAFVSVTHYERLAKYLPMAELGRDPRYVLVRKP